MRRYFKTGGRVGFSRAGPVGNLPWVRGTSRPGVKKAPRGAEHREAIKQEQGPKVVKGTPIRKEYAGLKRAHRTRQRLLKTKEARIQEGKSKAFHKKYIKPMSPETKASWSKGQHPKSWRRQQQKGIK